MTRGASSRQSLVWVKGGQTWRRSAATTASVASARGAVRAESSSALAASASVSIPVASPRWGSTPSTGTPHWSAIWAAFSAMKAGSSSPAASTTRPASRRRNRSRTVFREERGTSRPPTPSTRRRSQPAATASIDWARPSTSSSRPSAAAAARGERGSAKVASTASDGGAPIAAPSRTASSASVPGETPVATALTARQSMPARRRAAQRAAVSTVLPTPVPVPVTATIRPIRAGPGGGANPTAEGDGSGRSRLRPIRHDREDGGGDALDLRLGVAGADDQPEPAPPRLHGRWAEPLDQVAALPERQVELHRPGRVADQDGDDRGGGVGSPPRPLAGPPPEAPEM